MFDKEITHLCQKCGCYDNIIIPTYSKMAPWFEQGMTLSIGNGGVDPMKRLGRDEKIERGL